MDDGIHNSFLHPKMFKTKTLSIPQLENSIEIPKNDTKFTKKGNRNKRGKKVFET